MRKFDVRTPEDALSYLAECCLATVGHMAMLKSKSKSEFKRQISIAQTACNWIEDFGINARGIRTKEIIGKQTVEKWANLFISENKE